MAVLKLFQILILESWTDIMWTSINFNPIFGFLLFFFIITGIFIVINIFVAAIERKSEITYKRKGSKNMELVTQKEILFELLEIKKLSQ